MFGELKVGDTVVSTFWPYWLGGEMTPATKRDMPGDSVDGYAREYVCMAAHAFTKAPAGYRHLEAATLTCGRSRGAQLEVWYEGHHVANFERTLQMLQRAIDDCPDSAWDLPDEPASIWQYA